ncbi:MAG: ribonuclease HI [Candidatus Electrothrix sp. Rat3]|nr:ribonuclease HI [Candidatus Electrothrix rattekaaiensis]
MKKVTIYTDGGCQGNPGSGGYGAVLLYGEHRKELSGGYKLTTNNRMELLACIVALETLKEKYDVTVYSDSKYVVESFEKGWAKRWRITGWKRNKKDKAENPDLWGRLLDISEEHELKFSWVKGHAGNSENERCDTLAAEAAKQDNLPQDKKYEEAVNLKEQNLTYSLF